MSNLDKLIEWMEKNWINQNNPEYYLVEKIIIQAKQLQKEEPKTYTQEEIDKAKEESYGEGILFASKFGEIKTEEGESMSFTHTNIPLNNIPKTRQDLEGIMWTSSNNKELYQEHIDDIKRSSLERVENAKYNSVEDKTESIHRELNNPPKTV